MACTYLLLQNTSDAISVRDLMDFVLCYQLAVLLDAKSIFRAFVYYAHAHARVFSVVFIHRIIYNYFPVLVLQSFMCPSGINDFPMTNSSHIKVGFLMHGLASLITNLIRSNKIVFGVWNLLVQINAAYLFILSPFFQQY